MKKQLLKPTLILTGAIAATLFTGCASMNQGYSDVNGPRSALAFTTVTKPNELIKWTGDRYLQLALRSMDTYYFQVPDTGYSSGATTVRVNNPDVTVTAPDVTVRGPDVDVNAPAVVTTTPDVTVRDAAGAPAHYESGTRSYKIIEYRPGH